MWGGRKTRSHKYTSGSQLLRQSHLQIAAGAIHPSPFQAVLIIPDLPPSVPTLLLHHRHRSLLLFQCEPHPTMTRKRGFENDDDNETKLHSTREAEAHKRTKDHDDVHDLVLIPKDQAWQFDVLELYDPPTCSTWKPEGVMQERVPNPRSTCNPAYILCVMGSTTTQLDMLRYNDLQAQKKLIC